MAFAPGTLVGGRYELGRQLGTGGMARVYLAHDRLLDREVAVKVLADRYAADPAFVERFRREASAAAGLNHPNIVSVYDRGEAGGTYYIVMEYLSGPDLKGVIRRRAPLPPGEAVDYALQILSALAAAHRRDVIHRDVKPQNAMVAEDGHLKVTDFGIARAGADTGVTEAGSIIGTAQYLSPEQARGEEVTAASDCYSTGIVLYEMLTGRVPFDAERPVTVAMKQINEPPVPPRIYEPGVPPELDAVVLRALAKRPGDRYRTAEELSRALLDVRAGLPGGTGATRAFAAIDPAGRTRVMDGAPPTPTAETRVRTPTAATRVAPPPPDEAPPGRRSRLPLVIGLLVLLALVGAGAAFVLTRDGGPGMVAIPDVRGQAAGAARIALTDAGFDVRQSNEPSNAVDMGDVINTRPAVGSEVQDGSAVTLRVSGGPQQVDVPDVTTQAVADATGVLEDAGFTVTSSDAPSAEVGEGLVISQTPQGGSRVDSGREVALVVSTGPAQVTVPDLQQDSLDPTARAELDNAGLVVGGISDEESARFSPGTVIRQDPGPGSTVDEGSAVDVVIAAAPAPREVTVPDVVGLDAAGARAELEAVNLVVTSDSAPSDELEGTVIEQDPAADSTATEGDRAVIVVSSGPDLGGTGTTGTGTGAGTGGDGG